MSIYVILPMLPAIVGGIDTSKLRGVALMKALDEKGITFSLGETPRETVEGWLDNDYSNCKPGQSYGCNPSYVKLGQTLLKLLGGKSILTPSGGKLSLVNINASVNQYIDDNPDFPYEAAVKKALVYRWNEANGGSRDKTFDYITSSRETIGPPKASRYGSLGANELKNELEKRNILIADPQSGIPESTVLSWMNDPFSGYQQLARDLLSLLDDRQPLKIPAYERVDLVSLKGLVDNGKLLKDALVSRWNEKNGATSNMSFDDIAPKKVK